MVGAARDVCQENTVLSAMPDYVLTKVGTMLKLEGGIYPSVGQTVFVLQGAKLSFRPR